MKPKVVKSVHYTPGTKQHQSREYVDATDPELGLNPVDSSGREIQDRVISITSSIYPTKDKDGKTMETEYGLSTYKDHQTITLQEMPEKAPMGQLPRSVELVLDHDMVDRIKPGDRVQIVGVYRALATAVAGQASTSGVFQCVVLVNNIQILGRDVSHLTFTAQDVRTIRSLSKRPDILHILGRSFAPSIHGHDTIKKALALQQLSGCEKNLDNGTHLRGDINVLMVGDPSTAKSQLLRSAMSIAPLAVSTTGKGSSGVGLTAAVTSDPDTGERRLEAGAMVLADRGLVCVDEFDKMGENDRVAIHEAMEQQTVTIAKAGIHASLNARCSVLAAANPVYGQYDRKRRMQENIGLPDSLLSRFDLLFVVLDQLDPDTDRRISSHVIRGHRYRASTGHDSDDDDYNDSDDDDEDGNNKDGSDLMRRSHVHKVWQRSRQTDADQYALTQQTTSKSNDDDDNNNDPHRHDVLQHDFLRKYLHFAKTRIQPVLTDGARECIAGRYAEMRTRQDERTLPITARSLETIIRLASAHAKARLSPAVEADPDCTAALDILGFALYHENITTTTTTTVMDVDKDVSKRDNGTDGPTDSNKRTEVTDDEEGDGEDTHGPTQKRMRLDAQPDLKTRIWSEIIQLDQDNDTVTADKLCVDVQDRSLVDAVVQELEGQDRILVDDGNIYVTG